MSGSAAEARVDDSGPAPAGTTGTRTLRTLYLVRFGFAVAWAALLAPMAMTISPAVIALLVIYPLFDVAAAVIDFRSSGSTRAKAPLHVNVALSALAAASVLVAATSGVPSVLLVWGAWAIAAGIVQLIVAILRYQLGGQWAMILSGGLSVLAGSSFILMAGEPNASLKAVAGYATLGGIFFLISAIRLHRLSAKSPA